MGEILWSAALALLVVALSIAVVLAIIGLVALLVMLLKGGDDQ